jgi:hypothetical protein
VVGVVVVGVSVAAVGEVVADVMGVLIGAVVAGALGVIITVTVGLGNGFGVGSCAERGAAMMVVDPANTMLTAKLHTTRRTKRLDARILSPADGYTE